MPAVGGAGNRITEQAPLEELADGCHATQKQPTVFNRIKEEAHDEG